MPARLPVLRVRFFRTAEGREPVREWLKALPAAERKAIARILVTTFAGEAVLLHGFIKKSREMPLPELRLARRRKRDLT